MAYALGLGSSGEIHESSSLSYPTNFGEKMSTKVSLVSYTQLPDSAGKDLQEQIAYVARVSNPSNQSNPDNEKLIRYLIKHKHWSPFEMVSVCLSIDTTRDIARQILRHRSFSFQEFSQRYADPRNDLGFTTSEARLQDEKNRQNSIPVDDDRLQDEWEWWQQDVIALAIRAYEWAETKGIAKELRRKVLPEGLTNSRLYMTGNLRSWIHYVQLRKENGTQLEHQEVALKAADAIEPIFPLIKTV